MAVCPRTPSAVRIPRAHPSPNPKAPMTRRFPVLVALLTLPAMTTAEDASPVGPGAKLEKLAGGFKFTEGPAADADGNVYFTDQPNDRILKWSTDGKLTDFMEPCGRSNGLCFDTDGKLWACADEKNELWTIDVKTKEQTVVVKDYGGKLLNGPNDVWVRPDGGAYFTDPFYKRAYWKRGPKEQDTQARLLRVARRQADHSRGRRPEAAQRHHRHARRQDALRRRHRRRARRTRYDDPDGRHADEQASSSASSAPTA